MYHYSKCSITFNVLCFRSKTSITTGVVDRSELDKSDFMNDRLSPLNSMHMIQAALGLEISGKSIDLQNMDNVELEVMTSSNEVSFGYVAQSTT